MCLRNQTASRLNLSVGYFIFSLATPTWPGPAGRTSSSRPGSSGQRCAGGCCAGVSCLTRARGQSLFGPLVSYVA